jgi:putative aldouronate transport system substrate-binding protein
MDLMKHGIQGIHYEKKGDSFAPLPAFDSERPFLLYRVFYHPKDDIYQNSPRWESPEYIDKMLKLYRENEKYAYRDVAFGLVSDTYIKNGVNLKNKWNETMVKVILGELPASEVDKAVSEWKKNGGDQIIQEMNAAYLASK